MSETVVSETDALSWQSRREQPRGDFGAPAGPRSPQLARPTTRQLHDDEVSLKELLELLWRARFALLGVALLSGVFAYGAAKLITKRYSASVVLSPVIEEQSRMGGVGAALAQLGGLASLAGLPSAANSQRAETVAVLTSFDILDRYIRRNNLLPILYPDRWDPVNRRWMTGVHVPSMWEADQFFASSVRDISDDAKTGMVTLTITWTDPVTAAKWANGLVALADEYLRGQVIRAAEGNIAYLDGEVRKTSVVDEQQGIYALRAAQVRRVMLARGSEEFALKVIDPAMVPARPAYPRPLIWTVVAFALGFVFSALLVCVRAARRAA